MISVIRRRMGALAACALIVTACGNDAQPNDTRPHATGSAVAADDGPRPLTRDEAQRLAAMRFANFNAGVRAVEFEVKDSGQHYGVAGWVDLRATLGYGLVQADDPAEALLIAWTKEGIASHPADDADDAPPLPPPDESGWTSSALEPEASRLHTALTLVLAVAHDRPDNPLLLQQTDARWVRSDEIDGVTVDVFAGPTSDEPYDAETLSTAGDGGDATVRYWVDERGSLMRMEMRLGGAGEWTVADFADASGVDFADSFLETR